MAISIVLIDDHPLVLHGLEQLLQSGDDFTVLAACGTAAEGIKAVESTRPDVVVLDLNLPDMDGLDVLRLLDPRTVRVVVLTASGDEDEWLDAARLGARAVVLKAMAARVLEDCIRTVHAGGYELRVGEVDLSKRLIERSTAESALATLLTPRELEVVRLVASGLDNQQIAVRLSISVGTAKIHLHHVYDKLQLGGRHDLQVYLRSQHY
jgi:two-component system, NarL family, nitrate/nitrite response regulator NarL